MDDVVRERPETAPGDGFVAGLPKAELHLHLEGTLELEPEALFAFAERNGVALPYAHVDDLRAAYDFGCLQDFLDLYYRGTDVLRTAEDFHDLTLAYLERAAAENIRYAEVFFDPQAHTQRGVAFETVLDGIAAALDHGRREFGVTSGLIMCFLRDVDAASAMATLETALPHRHRIAGVDLDSAEVGHPPGPFTGVFRAARDAGFRAVAHAGEEGPADYVADALDLWGVERIDHGNRCLDDDGLVRRLARAGGPLTLCPLSNLRLGVVDNLRHHPLKRMMGLGLLVTVNSDDPAYFGGYLNANYLAIRDALGLDRADLATLARNGFVASFLDPEDKRALTAEVDAYVATGPAGS